MRMRALRISPFNLCVCLAIGINAAAISTSVLASGDDCESLPQRPRSDDRRERTASQGEPNEFKYCLHFIASLPGDHQNSATDINDRGDVIGDSGGWRSFLYSEGPLLPIEPLAGDGSSSVFKINDPGMIVGSSAKTGASTEIRPFVYSDGRATPLSGINDGIAYAINTLGQIVGAARGIGPFLYSEGGVVSLGKEGGAAYGINNKGHIVGRTDADRAFLYKDGSMTELGTVPGHSYSSAQAINDKDQVVGISAPTGVNDARAFLYSSDLGMINLGILQSSDSYSVATDINNWGVIVGFSGTDPDFYASAGQRGFVYADGKMTDLNALFSSCPGVALTAATAINDRGEIVGRGINGDRLHAFVLRPHQENQPCEKR